MDFRSFGPRHNSGRDRSLHIGMGSLFGTGVLTHTDIPRITQVILGFVAHSITHSALLTSAYLAQRVAVW